MPASLHRAGRLRAHARRASRTCSRRRARSPRGRLICVFGCGGDRDRGKRPLMGRGRHGGWPTSPIVTSDNPRSEDPEAIIAEIMAGRPDGRPSPTGARRSQRAVGMARPGDVVVIAGKGHEQGQQFADTRAALRRSHGRARGAGRGWPRMIPLTAREIAAACGGETAADGTVTGVSIDSRTVAARRPVRRAAGRAHRRRPVSSAAPCRRGRRSALATRRRSGPTARDRRRRPADRAGPDRGRGAAAIAAQPWSASPARPARPRPRTSWQRCCARRLRTVASPANFNTEIGLPLTLCRDRARDRGGGVRAGDARAGPDRLSGRDLPARRRRDHRRSAPRTWS